MKFLFSLLSILLFPDACNTNKNTMEAKSLEQASLDGIYIISEIGDKSIIDQTLKITFESNSNKVAGFGGCNRFFGTYTLQEGNISFSEIASSKMFCGKEIGTLEHNFFSNLKKSTKIELTKGTLIFYSKNIPILKGIKVVENKSEKKEALSTSSTIMYKAISRGSFQFIKISDTKVSISNDRDLKKFSDYTCSNTDREELENLLGKINFATLESLKAPTEKRLYDGAPIATLTIIKDGLEKTTPSFDHGYPPAEIKALVNKVLSIKENIEKQ